MRIQLQTRCRRSLICRFHLTEMLAVVLFHAPLAVAATTHYVAPDGRDTNPGTEEAPFRTVQQGTKHAGPGDTDYIRAGTYDLSGFSTTIDRPLSLIGEDKKSTVLANGGTLTFSRSLAVRNITFRNFSRTVLKPLAREGETLDGIFVEHCVFENLSSGINTGKDPRGVITNVRISNCEFRDMEGTGVAAIAFVYGLISDVRITNNSTMWRYATTAQRSRCGTRRERKATRTLSGRGMNSL